jgi:Rod binding domain-containing protein
MDIPATTMPLSLAHRQIQRDSAAQNVTATVDLNDQKLRETFTQFVGETFFSQMLASMRNSLEKPAYFHGGRAEEVFQGQLDQVLSERIATTSADRFAGSMYELFNLQRQ